MRQCHPSALCAQERTALKCGAFSFFPVSKFHEIHQAKFAIAPGKQDGTDDSVTVKICSDANGQCCARKLSGTFTDDWHRGSVEKWDKSYFGNCSDVLYKIKSYPQISISKNGKDSLKVLNVTLDMNVRDRKWDTAPKRLRQGIEREKGGKRKEARVRFQKNITVDN